MVGNPNWRRGVSGNPGGRPKVVTEVRDLARQHTGEAIMTLVAIMENEKAQPAAALPRPWPCRTMVRLSWLSSG
jgi:hypothetical protein